MTGRGLEGQCAAVTLPEQVYPSETQPPAQLIGVIGARDDGVVAIAGRTLRATTAQLVLEDHFVPDPRQIG
jgi:hypothetical protein